jgi:hypothetical protein
MIAFQGWQTRSSGTDWSDCNHTAIVHLEHLRHISTSKERSYSIVQRRARFFRFHGIAMAAKIPPSVTLIEAAPAMAPMAGNIRTPVLQKSFVCHYAANWRFHGDGLE